MAAPGTGVPKAEAEGDVDYAYNKAKLDKIAAAKPWLTNPKYFQTVRVSALAALKMMMHAHSGVEKGLARGSKPLEVMGLMWGHVDPENDKTLIVHDVFPLPVEGTETRVLADDDEVTNFMIKLSDSLEETRRERMMGWYHSHPFDVELHSHCFLSATDVSTQLGWQRMEDRAGNPWLAIVVDPLRSIAKSRPEFGAFRAYPPEYSPPDSETPDGKHLVDDSARVERWGAAWQRYHTLKIEFFMSDMSSAMVSILSRSFLWATVFGTTPMLERENRERVSDRIGTMTEKLESCGPSIADTHGGMMGGLERRGGAATEGSVLAKPTKASSELAIEQCRGQATQVVKSILFNADVHGSAPEVGAGAAGTDTGAGAGSGAGAGTDATAASEVDAAMRA